MRMLNLSISWLGIKFDAEANITGAVLTVGAIAFAVYLATV